MKIDNRRTLSLLAMALVVAVLFGMAPMASRAAVENDWGKNFSNAPMRALARYLLTQNCETQVIALDSNANDIQSTGGKGAILAGKPITLAADAAYDISAEAAYAAWVTNTAYTLNSEVTATVDGDTAHYVCILAHTSSAANQPNAGADWSSYWRRTYTWAVDAVGDVVSTSTTRTYLACALDTGVLRLFKAYDADGNIQIPAYDPTRYVPVALISVGTTSTVTIGTTSLTSISTIIQLTGPVLPDVDLIDR
jgi:hypothetical protein